jgi:hypothetical protein
VQIVGYETRPGSSDEHATLYIAFDSSVEQVPLAPGASLEYRLEDRHCAGRLTETGHDGCTEAVAPYCDRHTSSWPCARCTGNCDLPIDACQEEHAIYLAAFAPDTCKVGVTRSWRLETRLREQGADQAAHLRTVGNGRVAREIEAQLAVDVGDSVRMPAKIAGLHRDVADAAWADCLADRTPIETFEFEYGLDLADRPMVETMATGTVLGTKGRLLVLERTGGRYAVDLRDLVGYELSEGPTERDLQSSLGTFD